MANGVRINNLNQATSLNDTDTITIIQDNENKKAKISLLDNDKSYIQNVFNTIPDLITTSKANVETTKQAIDEKFGDDEFSAQIVTSQEMSSVGVSDDGSADVSSQVQDGFMESAILKGCTLVNRKKDNVVISTELSNCYDYTLSGCKNNTNYLLKFSAEHDEDVMVGFLIDTSTWSTTELKWAKPGNITVIINSGSTPNYLRIRAKSCENLMIIEYQDGMENWNIPYFEGMQSVKMPILTTSNCPCVFGKGGRL